MVEARCHCHSHLAVEEVVVGTESHLQVFVDHYCYHHFDKGVWNLVGHMAVEEVVEGPESHFQVFVDHYYYHHMDEGDRAKYAKVKRRYSTY